MPVASPGWSRQERKDTDEGKSESEAHPFHVRSLLIPGGCSKLTPSMQTLPVQTMTGQQALAFVKKGLEHG